MAQRRDEAWLTSAWDEASLVNAIVLAEFIRRTKSTRIIALITTGQLARDNCIPLRKTFHSVFDMDLLNDSSSLSKCEAELKAKIFAFSLRLFVKCVYLSPGSLVLENSDKLFEFSADFMCLRNAGDESIDWSVFVFKPGQRLWISFLESASGVQSGENGILSSALKKQSGWLDAGNISNGVVAKLCLNRGTLLTSDVNPSVIQFVGVEKQDLPRQLASIKKLDNGLREQFISATWLEIFEEKISTVLRDPITNHVNIEDASVYVNEPIAIVGMSCRYPGANSVEEFWNLLYRGEDAVREPPAFRWTKEHSIQMTPQERQTNAGFLSTKVDEFDARFFGVSPKDAAYMDPQTRLLHEVLWESLENAGIDPLSLHGTHTGIFTGSWMNDYKDILQCSTERDFFRIYMGNSIGASAARLSFLLGLTGPSVATESGCSAAIVALDLAVKSLRNGETNLAMAAGVNLLLRPFTSDIMEFVISPTGRCKTFDSKADGFGRAEGCGVLVLKRLSDALRDRDNIWAMIRGSAIAQEGLSRSLGTPTVHCEALAMELALKDANVHSDEVSFVETHGTGTPVGDPMEVAAIAKAYHSSNRESSLVIGSVKTNVGHTESCSGITGIIKTVLAMQHELIPKHLHLEELSTEIFLDSIPAVIPLEPVPWARVPGRPRIAGVSSFGITGTDGHVIIQEAPDIQLPTFNLGLERPTHILTISGKTREALEALLIDHENLFAETTKKQTDHDKFFANAAFTGNVGRANFHHRAFIIASDDVSAAKALKEKQFMEGELKDGENRQICFLFTGQGSQYQGMAKLLYETSPVFRIHFDICERILQETFNISVKTILWEGEPSSKELSRTIYSQTSIFCVEYCLLKLWESWGIKPDYVLGHSLGEFCAAVAAGILDFEDALKLVAERSRLIDSLPRGSMLVIKASKPEIERMMKDAKIDLDFAAVNNPEQTVVAGDTADVGKLLSHLKSQGVKSVVLEASHAFHSRQMDPILDEYRRIAETIKYKGGNGTTQYVSGMDGRIILDSAEISADYWVRHTRQPVSFIGACSALQDLGCQDFLEIGPQPVLSSFVMMNNERLALNCFPSLRRGTDDWNTILNSLGKLYLLGYHVDWREFDRPYIRNKVSLPFHPFHRKSFWVEPSLSPATPIHPLIGSAMKNASAVSIFQSDVTLKSVPYVKDHCVGDMIVFPGAGYTEMCLSAGYCVANGLTEALEPPRHAMRLENVRIEAPLELKEGRSCRFQVIVDLPEKKDCCKHENQVENHLENEGFQVKVYHQNVCNEETGKWVLHATSKFTPVASTKESMKLWDPNQIANIISNQEPIPTDTFYRNVNDAGLKFGESFRMLKRCWALKHPNSKINGKHIVAEMKLPSDLNKYLLHPLIIDACFQSGILTKLDSDDSRLKVPVRIGRLTVFPGVDLQPGNETLYLHAFCRDEKYHVFICTPDFTPLAHIEDVELVDTNVKTIRSVLEQQSSTIPDTWEEAWKVLPGPFSAPVNLDNSEAAFEDTDVIWKLKEFRNTPANDMELYKRTRRLTYLYILNGLLEIGWAPKVGQVIDVISFCEELGIQQEFRQQVRFYFTVLEEESILTSSDDGTTHWIISAVPPTLEEIRREMNSVRRSLDGTNIEPPVKVLENVSLSLSEILTGNESALQLLFPVGEDKQDLSAESFYKNHPGRKDVTGILIESWVALSRQLLLENGEETGRIYRTLEVGAGTGSLSIGSLKWLKKLWGKRFEAYYTDISQSFFIKAEKLLEEYRENVKYAVFNIEESPLSQGIPLQYFDAVAATDVLHATRNLEETLVHLRQTLRPGGALIFTETVVQSWDITSIFGVLSGYWRFEDFQSRPHHCCVSGEVWEQLLNKCGFQSVRIFKAYNDELATIVAFASSDVKLDALRVPNSSGDPTVASRKKWILFSEETSFKVTMELAKMLEASGNDVETVLSRNADFIKGDKMMRVIQADNEDSTEIEEILRGARDGRVQGIIYAWGMSIKERDQKKIVLPLLHIFKSLVGQQKPPQIYILTEGVHSVAEDSGSFNPFGATLVGMAKSLKNENTSLFVRCVDLEQGSSPKAKVDQVLFELAMSKGTRDQQRQQVAYRGNLRYEPRLVKGSLPKPGDELKLPPSTDRYQLKLPKTKVIQDLEFDTLEEYELAEDEVEVCMKAYALNFRDIFAVLKPSAEFENINNVGLDCAGVVVRAGPSSRYKVGDSVLGADNCKEAQLPSHRVLSSRYLLPIPEKMTFWEAATLPAVFTTAYYCLKTVAKMTSNDTVLIHTGSGGVGLAAIQLAQQYGATIVTTAGNERKRAYLRSLGIQHVFHSRDTSFEKDILRVTNGRGVDLVLNSITGPGIKEATLNATARNGRFIEMSKLSIWSVDEVKALRPDVNYQIVDLTKLGEDEWAKLLIILEEHLAENKFKSIPYVKFDALYIRQALQYFQKAKHIGKVVCCMPEVTKEEGQFKVKVDLFNRESTYLITGGLGGIGMEVCKWMLEHGASDIVLVGRSPPKLQMDREIKELNEKGANILVMLGDVGNYANLKSIVDEISRQGKPLRGVLHCAGVLRDNLYPNQTWEAFEATFNPKVNGTWNLHLLTANCNLEHFIVFSSAAALVGTIGQSNHAAANSFEDAFVHYRHSLGLPGISINWGQWAQVGVAKELNILGLFPVSTKRMLNGLELTMRTQTRQVALCDFESLTNMSLMCPMIKYYMEERLWNQVSGTSQQSEFLKAEQFWRDMDYKETKEEKLEVMTAYIKSILRSALRLEPDEPLNEDANIQELGVDSLMMIELRNSIQSMLGTRVNVTQNLLKDCTSIRLLSGAVVSKLLEEDEEGDDQAVELEPLPSAELIQLLNSDCILDEGIQLTSIPGASKPSEIRTVLITGVTGQLAPYLLSELTKSYKFLAKVVCLVRCPSSSVDAAARVTASLKSFSLDTEVDLSKVECIGGDVIKENLGLPKKTYDALCGDVDAVIHCAAKVHHSEQYRNSDNQKHTEIRSVNVGGLLNILKFATTGKTKHIYYPSMFLCGIFEENEEGTLSDDWPTQAILQTMVENKIPGLLTSRLISELLLKQANERGVPCKVFRFPWISGESKTGRLRYLNNLYIFRFLSFLKLNSMPSLAFPANFLPVDKCAELSLRLFFSDEVPCEIFNIGHPQPQMEVEFVEVAKMHFGKNLEVLDWTNFATLLDDNDQQSDDELRNLCKLQKMMGIYLADAVGMVKGYFISPETFFTNRKLEKYAPDHGNGIPSSMDILKNDLDFLKSTGFLDKFLQ